MVCDGTDGGEYGCHDRKADVIRNEHDARDGFGITQLREDAMQYWKNRTSLDQQLDCSQRQ
jgi:hypothetical protein